MTRTGTKYISAFIASLEQILLKNIERFLETYENNYIIYIEAMYVLMLFFGYFSAYLVGEDNKLKASDNMGRVLIIPYDILK